MLHRKQHIAVKNKAKKAFFFLALLLSIFTISGVTNITQHNNSRVQSELVLPAVRFAKSSISYSRITRNNHKQQYFFLSQRLQFAIAIANFTRTIATRQTQQPISAIPKQRQFLQFHNYIPTATEPPLQA